MAGSAAAVGGVGLPRVDDMPPALAGGICSSLWLAGFLPLSGFRPPACPRPPACLRLPIPLYVRASRATRRWRRHALVRRAVCTGVQFLFLYRSFLPAFAVARNGRREAGVKQKKTWSKSWCALATSAAGQSLRPRIPRELPSKASVCTCRGSGGRAAVSQPGGEAQIEHDKNLA